MSKLVLLLFFISPSLAIAQFSEIGLGVGGINYAGDLMRGYHIENMKPGIVGYYKMNLDNIFSLRASLTGGLVSGSDNQPIDPFANNRKGSFQSTLIEAAGLLEYNFLNFKADKVHIRWTPYMFAGIGVFAFMGGNQDLQGTSKVQPALPFGGGFKYAINPNLTLNVEIGLRKLFTDHLDGYSDGDITNKTINTATSMTKTGTILSVFHSVISFGKYLVPTTFIKVLYLKALL
ncbi:MAG: porin family protein [Cyclobacteriaceae bacterium]|nr:porin family protein [Cyclobacteriaceae bacterium]